MADVKSTARAFSALALSLSFVFANGSAAWSAAGGRAVTPQLYDLLKKGYQQMQKGSYEPAVQTLIQAVQIDRNSVTARRYLGFALLQSGSNELAIQQLQLVQRMTRATPFDTYSLAQAYFQSGNFKLAEDAYRNAVDQNPNFDLARSGLIKTLISVNNYDDAFSQCLEGYRNSRDENMSKYYRQLYQSVQESKLSLHKFATGTTAVASNTPQAAELPSWQQPTTPESITQTIGEATAKQ